MIIYIDRLTFRTSLVILRILRERKTAGSDKIRLNILDPVPGGIRTALLKFGFRRLGHSIEEIPFFAGHLKSPDGQSVYTTAVSSANKSSLNAAKMTLVCSPLLSGLNKRWGGVAVELFLAKSFWWLTFNLARRLMVADALARKEEETETHHIAEIPPAIDPEWIDGLHELKTKVHFSTFRSLRDRRLYGLLWCLAQMARDAWRRLKARYVTTGSHLRGNVPALLLLQEDELSLDRSLRTQPHWYYSEDGQLPFDVLILQSDFFKESKVDQKQLAAERIIPIAPEEFSSTGVSARHPLRRRIRKDSRSLVMKSAVGGVSARACAEVVRLFLYADILAAFCLKQNVRVFMTCENYMVLADAMRMIAADLEIHTVSYQYANNSEVSPLMMTAADTMFFFSPLYHKRWSRNGISPATFVDTGYLFDRSFGIVRERAQSSREKLRRAGAQFVICYLDESVQDDKYGLIHRSDHIGDIRALIHHMLKDPSTALVVKTQFKRNSPMNLDGMGDLFSLAVQSGRYIELSHGQPRNSIFPAEAALCSDIVIGHAIGATAALEAALTGVRCILLNPYGFKGANDLIYREADILYPSMESALVAIEEYRSGNPKRTNLGDWSSIIGRFDAFRDGRASIRLRHHLEILFKEAKLFSAN